jgi:hypothetical protein
MERLAIRIKGIRAPRQRSFSKNDALTLKYAAACFVDSNGMFKIYSRMLLSKIAGCILMVLDKLENSRLG